MQVTIISNSRTICNLQLLLTAGMRTCWIKCNQTRRKEAKLEFRVEIGLEKKPKSAKNRKKPDKIFQHVLFPTINKQLLNEVE